MRLIDTVALIGSLNPRDREHAHSLQHIRHVASRDDLYVPMASLIEADLVMKIRGYDHMEREVSWKALEARIPKGKILANPVSTIRLAIELQKEGMDYFDSLITSLAKETNSTVITTDRAIQTVVPTEW